jgi:hypothetical protein
MTHAELIAQILALCRKHRLQAFYWPDSRKARRRGWPDLMIGGPAGWRFREVKTPFDRLSSEQRQVGYLLAAAGLNWDVWRPADLASGQIEDELRVLSGKIPVC